MSDHPRVLWATLAGVVVLAATFAAFALLVDHGGDHASAPGGDPAAEAGTEREAATGAGAGAVPAGPPATTSIAPGVVVERAQPTDHRPPGPGEAAWDGAAGSGWDEAAGSGGAAGSDGTGGPGGAGPGGGDGDPSSGHAQDRVSIVGPGGILLHGTYTLRDGEDWTIVVDGATGRVGGVAVGVASGEIASAGGVVAADVHVDLPGHPQVVPAWSSTAHLRVSHDGAALVGLVEVSTSRGTSGLAMSGRVADDGSYSLGVTGQVDFAGSLLPLGGTYHGRAGAYGPEHRWSIRGAGGTGAIHDVAVHDVSVDMGEARPGVTGSAHLSFEGTSVLVVHADLAFVDAGNWELVARSASPATWSPRLLPSLTTEGGAVTGGVRSTAGHLTWDLGGPMHLHEEDLVLSGTISLQGAQRHRVVVTGAAGSVLGSPREVDFTRSHGTIVLGASKVSGWVHLSAEGELLVDMPDGWVSSTDLWLRYETTGAGTTSTFRVEHSMVVGRSALRLHGTIDSSSRFALEVGGWLSMAGARIPFGGSYLSAGNVVDGVRLAEPAWSIRGDVADVEGGTIGLGGGAAIVRGAIGLASPDTPATVAPTSAATPADDPSPPDAPTTISGEVEIQLSEGDPFTLAAELDYGDDDDWTLTVASTQAQPWTPPGMTGLTIGVESFSGTITSEEGEITWDVAIDEVAWEDVTPGVDLTTGFTLGTTCPLEAHCPEADGVFAGFHDGELTFPDDVPDLWLHGAFLADGSWARFEAGPDDVTFGPVEIRDSSFTMWKGPRTDTFDADLEMPDLREDNHGFALEFCGYFRVEVPDVDTVETGGCSAWSPGGVVIGQVGTGGRIDDSGEHNGVRIGNVELQGFGWTDLDFEPSLVISGIELPLVEGRNHLTAEMHIPAELMKATGNPDADASIGATGWFGGSDFHLLGHIDVSMRSGGVTLDRVSVEIGKDGDRFALGLGADATVSMSGNHFPVSAFVGVEGGGGSGEITVRVSAKGTESDEPAGSFELPTLLPSGTFEPTYDSMLDGSFDAKPDPSLLTNGSFEEAVPSQNLVGNADFERGVGAELAPWGDFEGGEAGNLLPNADFEDNDVARNGDFERGDATGWTVTSDYSMSVLPGAAPTEDQGDHIVEVRNGTASGNVVTSASGLFQDVHWPTVPGARYELSAWMRTADASSTSVALFVDQKGTAPGCATQSTARTTQTSTVDGTWRRFSLAVDGEACRATSTLVVNPTQGGARVQVDAIRFELVDSPVVVEVPNTDRPWMRSTTGTAFDSMPPITRSSSSDIELRDDYGNPGRSLRSNGNNKWWLFHKGSYGDVTGDFEISYDVYFAESNSREILDIGFWMTGKDGNNDATGYVFRVETNNNPAGFYRITNGNRSRISDDGSSPLERQVWHRVHLTAVGSTVTATIERLDTGEQVYRRIDTMPSGNRAGVFGQIKTNHGATPGHRLDNFHVVSGAPSHQAVRFDPGAARSGRQYLVMRSPTTDWSMLTTSAEVPEAGQIYTYTVHVRATAPLAGHVVIETEGGVREATSTAVYLGSPGTAGTWTRISVTLPITRSDHVGLRVGFTGMDAADVELHVDDATLQEVGWQASPTTPGGLIALVAGEGGGSTVRTGTGSLFLMNRASTTSSLSRDLAAPEAGATYTATMWMTSDFASEVALRLTAVGGTEETAVSTRTTTVGSWQEHRVTLPVTRADHTALRLTLEVRGPYAHVYVDDVAVQGAGTSVPQDPTATWVGTGSTFDGMPPISGSGSSLALASDHGNPGSSLRSNGDRHWWWFDQGSYGDVAGDFDLSYDVYFPEADRRDMLDMGYWLTGTGTDETGYLFRVQSDNDNGGFYRIDGGDKSRLPGDADMPILARDAWHRVRLTATGADVSATVTRLDTQEELYRHTVTMPAGNRAGVLGQVGSSNGSSAGHRLDNLFVYRGSNAAWPRVLDDPAHARTGSGFLRVQNPAGSAQGASYWTDVVPTVGSTYLARAWVRAPGGTVTGSLRALTGAEVASSPFTATGTWQEVTARITVTQPGTGLALVVQNDAPGAAIDVDDVSLQLEGLTQREPWVGASEPGGVVQATVRADAAGARSGSAYLEVQASGAPGSVSATVANPAGEVIHTAVAWVRSATGSPVSGSLELAADGAGRSRRSPFTATGAWQPVYVTLPAVEDLSTLRTSVHVTTADTPLSIDDVTVRSLPTWVPLGPAEVLVDEVVMIDGSSASGPGHLRVRSSGPGGGVQASSPAEVRPGGSYTVQAYVRSADGTAVDGRLELAATGATDESAALPFTATAEWRHVELTLAATQGNTALQPAVVLTQAGELDLDQITVTQDVIVQDDPWTVEPAPGGSMSATVHEDPDRAHDSSGLMVLRTEGAAGSGISHGIDHAPTPGATYAGSAWVRSPSGAPVAGRFQVAALGGAGAEATAAFVADGSWQQVSVRLPIGGSHPSMRASLTVDTPGVELHVDDVKVQQERWTTYAPDGSQVSLTQVNDGEGAESGNGYATVTRHHGPEGGIQLDTPGPVAQGSSQTVSAYVRSTDGRETPGRLRLAATGGDADDVATTGFIAGAAWKKVSLTLDVAHGGQGALRTQVLVDDVGVGIDVDSVTIGQEPLGDPDGVTTPLPHPERGYAYLWDDAFGIKGAHLWSITAQIQFVDGSPGLGVGGTLYFDPTQMPGVLVGTEWLKADMTMNVSRADPCMAFGFDGTGTDTRVEIQGGVLSTSKFVLGFAPRGCEVGDYVVPPGASLAFDTELGSSTLHLDLQIGRDDDGLPTFYTDMAVHDLVIAGTRYHTMQLLVDVSVDRSYVGLLGDFSLPMGEFSGDFELSVNADLLHMEGAVSVRDWTMAGGGFEVHEFDYHQVLDVPFGAGACASFSSATDGRMSLGGKRYAFDGGIEIDCGVLKVLHVEFDYLKGGMAYRFDLDYDGGTRRFEGGVGFAFERKTSWRFFGHRYRRHPKFQVDVHYAMHVDKPSSAAFTIKGKVSVSGGSGSLSCSINTGSDDGCSIYVRINKFGGHTYRSSW